MASSAPSPTRSSPWASNKSFQTSSQTTRLIPSILRWKGSGMSTSRGQPGSALTMRIALWQRKELFRGSSCLPSCSTHSLSTLLTSSILTCSPILTLNCECKRLANRRASLTATRWPWTRTLRYFNRFRMQISPFCATSTNLIGTRSRGCWPA